MHRVVKGMYMQCGNLNKHFAKENTSIFGGEFADESYEIKHTEIGLLGMCKRKSYHHSNMC